MERDKIARLSLPHSLLSCAHSPPRPQCPPLSPIGRLCSCELVQALAHLVAEVDPLDRAAARLFVAEVNSSGDLSPHWCRPPVCTVCLRPLLVGA